MIRRHPRSTLFPYTPLSRSQERHADVAAEQIVHRRAATFVGNVRDVDAGLLMQQLAGEMMRRASAGGAVIELAGILARSEEHTSELQSRSDLVCRLLLEKKK